MSVFSADTNECRVYTFSKVFVRGLFSSELRRDDLTLILNSISGVSRYQLSVVGMLHKGRMSWMFAS